MTTPNTESKPVTDAEIEKRHTRGKSENEYWTFQQQLVARIEQEREIRRELAGHLAGALLLFSDDGWDKGARASLARAAKMEENNVR